MEENMISKLSKQKNWLKSGYIGVVALYLCGAVLLFYNRKAAIIEINAVTLFYFLGIRYIDKKYEKNFQKVNLQLILKPLMNNIVIMDRGDIKAVQLRKEGILPVREKGGVACGVWVKGVRGGRNIEGGELTVCYDKKEEKKIGFLNGIYFSKEEEGIKNMLFISKQLLKNGIAPMFYEKQGLIEVPITDNKLSREYYLYMNDDRDIENEKEFFRRFKKVIEKQSDLKQPLIIQVGYDKMQMFLAGRGFEFPVLLRGKLTDEIVGWNQIPEIIEVLK